MTHLQMTKPKVSLQVHGDLNDEHLRRLFEQERLYPVQLVDGVIHQAAIQQYVRWMHSENRNFDPAKHPWLPVGCVGPVLVLGHSAPSMRTAPLPAGLFQPVLLWPMDYDRMLHNVREIIQREMEKPWPGISDDYAPPQQLPERPVLPMGTSATLDFVCQYFPLLGSEARILEKLRGRPGVSLDDLPSGFAGAFEFIERRVAIADTTILSVPEEIVAKVRENTPGYVPVAVRGQSLWVAGYKRLPNTLKDRLREALGAGWKVFPLLSDAPRGMASASDSGANATDPGASKAVQDECVTIDVRRASRDEAGEELRSATASKTVVFSEKELERYRVYDVRTPDRTPLDVVHKYLIRAFDEGASDLHFEPGADSYRIRARVNGLLEQWFESKDLGFGRQVVVAANNAVHMKTELYRTEDDKCTIHFGGTQINVRISALPCLGEYRKLVLRFLPRRGQAPKIEELLPERGAKYLRKAAMAPQGLILIVGPTGSGKTTTTFAALSAINSVTKNLTTLEDPIEYVLGGVNQAELNETREVTWDALQKAFLRQDPDVGLLGEIRDLESAKVAIAQSLTGHTIFATLHTNSCVATMMRLMDMGVNLNSLASALTLILSQRLVGKVCPKCSSTRAPTDAEVQVFERHGILVPRDLREHKSAGCPACRKGWIGRMAVFEALPVTPAVQHLIVSNAKAEEFSAWMKKKQLHTIFECALRAVADGKTTFAEAAEWQPVWEDFPELNDEEAVQ